MPEKITIFWFRNDLRIFDNPGLIEAAKHGSVMPIYILETPEPQEAFKRADASLEWLHSSLSSLNHSLQDTLTLYRGNPKDIFLKLLEKTSFHAVYWNRRYEPFKISKDASLKKFLETLNIECKSFKASLLWEPWEVVKKDGTPYKIYTAFHKACLQDLFPRKPLPTPEDFTLLKAPCLSYENTQAPCSFPKWSKILKSSWTAGETAAQKKLDLFLKNGLEGYQEGRNFPSKCHVSKLSPHLHFGEISPHWIWERAQLSGHIHKEEKDLDCFLKELVWREFSYSLLYHFPELPFNNLRSKFNAFPWQENSSLLQAWQNGQTGFPFVDAGMRELLQTGYMHNRLRMVVASFLVKNLLLHWHHGEAWFWNCLFDADLANNSASWQWVAGCGVDAAPYFRVFNPILQGEKYDPHGTYTRKFVPELSLLPNAYLFKPWKAPAHVLKDSAITLGSSYPHPIVDLELSRNRALKAYQAL